MQLLICVRSFVLYLAFAVVSKCRLNSFQQRAMVKFMLRQLVTVTWEQGCFCTAEEGYGHPCILLNLFLNAGLNGSHAKHCLGTWDFITDAGIKKVDQWTSQLKEVFMWCPTIYWLLNWVIVWFYLYLLCTYNCTYLLLSLQGQSPSAM